MAGKGGPLHRLAERLGRSKEDHDSLELQASSSESGGCHISALQVRERATVVGEVQSITLRPRSDVPALVAKLHDGTDSINLVWLGRREIAGIKPGCTLKAAGMVTIHRGQLTIFNPAYSLTAQHHG